MELRSARRPIVVTHENPDGDALGSLIAMQGILTAIGKDCEMYIDGRDLPLPQEYAFFPLQNLICEPPADFRERTIVFLDCGNLARNPAQEFGAAGRPDPQHRPPPRQHAVRHGQPRRRRGLVHRRDRLGADACARRHPDADRRRRAVRGIDHRHRPLHVREHRASGAPDGGRPDRRGSRRQRPLPPRLRGRPVRQAGAAGARPLQRRALRRRAADDERADASPISTTPKPRRATPRG